MKFGVVGFGVVGQHMAADIKRAGHKSAIFDINGAGSFEAVNECDAAFVCVPTPQGANGAANLRAIDDVFAWLRVPIAIIRSTIPPGTTDRLASDGHQVVFCPEFIGEGINPPYSAMQQPPFLIVGGEPCARSLAFAALAHLYNAECELIGVSATSAELAKYAENYFLALKVTWANELYDICGQVGADYVEMMAALTHDHRIGRSHTHVYPDNRGWGGRCLPKDTAALLALAGEDGAPLLAAMRRINEKQRAGDQGRAL